MKSLWTDGSCWWKTRCGGWAFIYEEEGEIRLEKSGGLTNAGVNEAELTAVLEGLQVIELGSEVHVWTDSMNVVKWLTGGQRAYNPSIRDLRQRIFRVAHARRLVVHLHHVRGHQGVELNERAHSLASEAMRALKTP